MTKIRRCLPPLVAASATLLFGCRDAVHQIPPQGPGGARVVRLIYEDDEGRWTIRVNEAVASAGSLQELPFRLARLGLRHEDVVIVNPLRSIESAPPGRAVLSWLMTYCRTNQTALYSFPGSDLLNITIYHWTAPLGPPTRLAEAYFFREGQGLGKGTNGFQNMLQSIERHKSRVILILGTRYADTGSAPPLWTPYEDQQATLEAALEKSHTSIVYPSELP